MTEMAMFPLGVVHFPHVFLPLRVFEPRYRLLTRDCLAGDGEFGVVLIERGSEVGGGDERFDIGTVTRIVDAGVDPSGMIRLTTLGTRRIRVRTWLDDDPYPRADVEPMSAPDLGAVEQGALAGAERVVRRALALRAELNEPAAPFNVELDGDPAAPFNVELDGDPARAMFQLSAIAPIGATDQQRVLGIEDPGALLAALTELVAEEIGFLEQRLAAG